MKDLAYAPATTRETRRISPKEPRTCHRVQEEHLLVQELKDLAPVIGNSFRLYPGLTVQFLPGGWVKANDQIFPGVRRFVRWTLRQYW